MSRYHKKINAWSYKSCTSFSVHRKLTVNFDGRPMAFSIFSLKYTSLPSSSDGSSTKTSSSESSFPDLLQGTSSIWGRKYLSSLYNKEKHNECNLLYWYDIPCRWSKNIYYNNSFSYSLWKNLQLIDLGAIVFLMCNSNIETKHELVYELRKRRDLHWLFRLHILWSQWHLIVPSWQSCKYNNGTKWNSFHQSIWFNVSIWYMN